MDVGLADRIGGNFMVEHIFISYSRADSIFADQLAADLESSGFRVWIDQAATRGGEAWRAEIERNLRDAMVVIAILSEDSIRSRWVNQQGSLANGLGKKVISVVLASDLSLPDWVDEEQVIPCYSEDGYAEALETLTGGIYPPPAEIEERLRHIQSRLVVTKDAVGLARLGSELEEVLWAFPHGKQSRQAHILLQEIQKQMRPPAPAPEPRARPARRKLPVWIWVAGIFLCFLVAMLLFLFRDGLAAILFADTAPTPSPTSTWTLTATATHTPGVTGTATSSLTPTATLSPTLTLTPTVTLTPTLTLTPTGTLEPSLTPTPTLTPSLTSSATATPTATPTVTPSPTSTLTPSLTPTATRTPTLTITPSPTSSPTPTSTPVFCALEDFEGGRQNEWLPPDPEVFWYWDLSQLNPPQRGSDALAVTYYRPETDQFIAFEVVVDCDFSEFGRIQLWVFGDVSLLLELEDRGSNSLALEPSATPGPRGWVLLEYDYSGAGSNLDLDAVETVKIFIIPDDPATDGQIALDEIILVP